jgi:hypothetical protein
MTCQRRNSEFGADEGLNGRKRRVAKALVDI